MVERDTAESLVKILGIVYIVFGALAAFAGMMMTIGASFMAGLMPGFGGLGGGLLAMVGVFMLVVAALQILVGVALMQFKPWARIAGIVVAALSLFSFPFGTALGVFAIWLLGFERNAIALFTGTPPAAAVRQPPAPPSY